jgi:hypothetical protein
MADKEHRPVRPEEERHGEVVDGLWSRAGPTRTAALHRPSKGSRWMFYGDTCINSESHASFSDAGAQVPNDTTPASPVASMDADLAQPLLR